MRGVKMINNCEYQRVDDQGLHVLINGEAQCLAVDNIVICAGQLPQRELQAALTKPNHLIGGADVATELDAKRAIAQGLKLAISLP